MIGKRLNFKTVLQGTGRNSPTGPGNTFYEVITDRDRWLRFMIAESPAMDFSKEMLLYICCKRCDSNDYRVEIFDVVEYDKWVIVEYQICLSKPYDFAAAKVDVYPCIIARCDKSNKPLYFQETRITINRKLYVACYEGDEAEVDYWMKRGADVNHHGIKIESTPLMEAARIGHLGIVKKLLAAGAKVDEKDFDYWTALMYASSGGHIEVVKELLAMHPDMSIENDNGDTALDVAINNGQVEVEELLRQHGAK